MSTRLRAASSGSPPLAAAASSASHEQGTSEGASRRERAVAALVEAATRLFAASGPDGVSLRTVAAEAGVNYGLIHQYVGNKEDLLRLVFRSVSEKAAAGFAEASDLDSAVDEMFGEEPSAYVAMLAWTLLQDRDASELLGRSPALDALADRIGEGDADERAARLATVTALSLGWRLFGRFVAAGVGADDPSELTPRVRRLARALLSNEMSAVPRDDS